MNLFNATIVALALSTFACGTAATKNAETAKVYYVQRPVTYDDRIVTVSEVSNFKLVKVSCKDSTGTDTWLPTGHENEMDPSTQDDTIAWTLANSSHTSNDTSISITEQCSNGKIAAPSGIKRMLNESELATVATK